MSIAGAQGIDDAADLAIQTQKGILDAQRVKACYEEIARLGGINYITTAAGAKKKDECDAMQAALHTELARRGTGTVLGALGGTFVGAATGAGLAAGGLFTAGAAPIAAGAIVVVGAGYAASSAVGMIWELLHRAGRAGHQTCRGQNAPGGTPMWHSVWPRQARPRIPIPVAGKGTLALYADGRAPLIIRDVIVKEGQDTTIDGSPVPLDRANPGDMARTARAVRQGAKPAGATAAVPPPAAPPPDPGSSTGGKCWTRSPVDSASNTVAPGVFTFNFGDGSVEVLDSGAAFTSPRGAREKAVASSKSSFSWNMPERICTGDAVSFSIKQSGKFNAYPCPSLGEADKYASAQALVSGVLKGDRFAAGGSTIETVGPFTANAWKITPPAERRAFKVGLLLSGQGGLYTAAAIWMYQPQ